MAEATGATLLDTVLEGLGDRPLVTTARICLVGKLSGESPPATFASWCDNYCRSPADVTGLLLLLDSGWIMTVEGQTSDLLPLLRGMEEQLTPGGSLSTVKVVAQQEDVRCRYYPKWCAATARPSSLFPLFSGAETDVARFCSRLPGATTRCRSSVAITPRSR